MGVLTDDLHYQIHRALVSVAPLSLAFYAFLAEPRIPVMVSI